MSTDYSPPSALDQTSSLHLDFDEKKGIDSPRPLYTTCTISTGQTSLFPAFPLILRGRESLDHPHPLFAACHLISTGRGGSNPPRPLFTTP